MTVLRSCYNPTHCQLKESHSRSQSFDPFAAADQKDRSSGNENEGILVGRRKDSTRAARNLPNDVNKGCSVAFHFVWCQAKFFSASGGFHFHGQKKKMTAYPEIAGNRSVGKSVHIYFSNIRQFFSRLHMLMKKSTSILSNQV